MTFSFLFLCFFVCNHFITNAHLSESSLDDSTCSYKHDASCSMTIEYVMKEVEDMMNRTASLLVGSSVRLRDINSSSDSVEVKGAVVQWQEWKRAWKVRLENGKTIVVKPAYLEALDQEVAGVKALWGFEQCQLGSGGDILGSLRNMTLDTARQICIMVPECVGISTSTGSRVNAHALYKIQFKNQFQCAGEDDERISLRVRQSPAQTDYVSEVPWEPPGLRPWQSQPNARFLSEDPVLVQFDGFLHENEINHVVNLKHGCLQPSAPGAYSNCFFNAESDDRILLQIQERVAEFAGVQPSFLENLELLKYMPGLTTRGKHMDYVESQRRQLCGPRVATFLIYLNDVASGGATEFPMLNLKVLPARGRALLWWNVDLHRLLDGVQPEQLKGDPRVVHSALPVQEGVKWALNVVIHARDFQNNFKRGWIGADN